MASETFDNRLNLRARLRARLGMSTNDTVMAQTTAQHNEYLSMAARYVRDLCTWKRLEQETEFDTVIGTATYAYPANSGAGDIMRVARWDATALRFIELQRRVILPVLDIVSTISPTDKTNKEDMPLYFEERSKAVANSGPATGTRYDPFLELWPIPDAVYTLKVWYQIGGAQLADDTTPCIVDADLVLLWALADAFEERGDKDLAEMQRAKFETRRRKIAGSQRSREPIMLDRARQVALRFRAIDPARPNPTVYPYNSVMGP